MEMLEQIVVRTPLWVWVLFVWLVFRGIKARQPGETSLVKLSIIPVVFMAWGLYDLVRLYGAGPTPTALWLAGILMGAAIGWRLIGGIAIVADRAAGVLRRPAD
jgi:hypothetical protein